MTLLQRSEQKLELAYYTKDSIIGGAKAIHDSS